MTSKLSKFAAPLLAPVIMAATSEIATASTEVIYIFGVDSTTVMWASAGATVAGLAGKAICSLIESKPKPYKPSCYPESPKEGEYVDSTEIYDRVYR